jgi:predicted dehydrogenase
MYLHASDKTTGVENFHAAIANPLLRRAMIQKALRQGLLPGKGLEAAIFNYRPPEKPLAVGLLGAGQQGRRLLRAVSSKYLAVKSIADLRPSNRKLAAEIAKDAHVYDSYEKLLAAAKDDGLEAVIIALPSHLHGPAALAALDKGLHVFVEPPMALKVTEAKQIVAKAQEKKLCVAVGQQRRYNWIYDHALEMVRKDLLDQVHYLRAQWHMAKAGKTNGTAKETIAKAKADENGALDEALKYRLDWWQDVPKEDAAAAYDGYGSREELLRWQLYDKYSGGLLAELGSQLFDSAVMLVAASPNHDPKRPYPLSVTGSGSQVLSAAADEIDDHVHCIFEYAIQGYVDDKSIPPKARKKIAVQFDMILGSDFDGYGETVLGRKGSLVLENEQKPMLFFMADVDKQVRLIEKKDPKGLPDLQLLKDAKFDEESAALGQLALHGADAGFATELEHWSYCCKPAADGKGDSKPRCDAQAGLYTTVLTVAATKAVQLGTRVDFKSEWFDAKSKETPDEPAADVS